MLILAKGFITLILAIIPFIFINRSIKTLSRISFCVLLFLVLPHLIFHHSFFHLEVMEKELFSLEDALSLGAIAFLPLVIKSTILLHRHEIRLFVYIRNISIFLFIALINDFIKVFYLVERFISYASAYYS